jgi:hypothetical protein
MAGLQREEPAAEPDGQDDSRSIARWRIRFYRRPAAQNKAFVTVRTLEILTIAQSDALAT